tara:strand:+ start:1324 stop:1749 length:426 start_codon:yes stop_codon:yes gene_type:complete
LNNKISDKDKKDWEDFISDNSTLPNKDFDNSKKNKIESKYYDFHGYSLNEANIKIENLIKVSFENGVRKIVVITGKGLHSENDKDPYKSKDLSILRFSLPEYIKNNLELMKFINEIKEANIEDGGSGAFYIFLKKNNNFRE